MSKPDRQVVLDKYSSHCAYCGKLITLSTMQVDHIVPKARCPKHLLICLSNLNPSCFQCNYYKGARTLEGFRNKVKGLRRRMEKMFVIKLGLDYGIVKLEKWDKKFYFEKF